MAHDAAVTTVNTFHASKDGVNPAAALPTGTVTFLFSDIEGSTQRWESNRPAMQEALRRHDKLMNEAIASNDGHVFKTMGDAFCSAFSAVPNAIGAALAAQRALKNENFSAVDGLNVRMAIHVGLADERNGDYFGPSVNRVARLLAIGHGGQVLLSGAAADLAQGEMPAQRPRVAAVVLALALARGASQQPAAAAHQFSRPRRRGGAPARAPEDRAPADAGRHGRGRQEPPLTASRCRPARSLRRRRLVRRARAHLGSRSRAERDRVGLRNRRVREAAVAGDDHPTPQRQAYAVDRGQLRARRCGRRQGD
ncbi:MAG: hypothetical protein DLM53_06835 [Candidatus Eremiobacter antarcticus]|nr:MAG: hypothetical protein DLM53_06835 [Candidatus Eremiobacter sp. RRmetagenome_bin22]